MQKTIRATIIVLLLLFSVSIVAQEPYTRVGARVGGGLSRMSGMSKFEKWKRLPGTYVQTLDHYETQPSYNWDLGIIVQHVRDKLMFQSDISLVSVLNTKFKGASSDGRAVTRFEILYHTIDAKVGVNTPINDDVTFIAAAGPYVSFNVRGWLKDHNKRYGEDWDGSLYVHGGTLKATQSDFKDYDFGAVALVGIEVENLQIGLSYHHGLLNITKNDFALYNRMCKLSLGVFF